MAPRRPLRAATRLILLLAGFHMRGLLRLIKTTPLSLMVTTPALRSTAARTTPLRRLAWAQVRESRPVVTTPPPLLASTQVPSPVSVMATLPKPKATAPAPPRRAAIPRPRPSGRTPMPTRSPPTPTTPPSPMVTGRALGSRREATTPLERWPTERAPSPEVATTTPRLPTSSTGPPKPPETTTRRRTARPSGATCPVLCDSAGLTAHPAADASHKRVLGARCLVLGRLTADSFPLGSCPVAAGDLAGDVGPVVPQGSDSVSWSGRVSDCRGRKGSEAISVHSMWSKPRQARELGGLRPSRGRPSSPR